MDDKKDLYYHASGVDITRNYQDNGEMRAVGYDGEYAVFCTLLDHFLDENLKVLMNVNVPTGQGQKTTEIDCLLICKVGLVSFEIKNYKGTIYGDPDQQRWTQYFRTAENHSFDNPLRQNAYHIQALQSLYPGVPCYSVIVFTNPDCDISRVAFRERQGPVSKEFCIAARNMVDTLQSIFSRNAVLNDAKIEGLFKELRQYAPNYSPISVKGDKITSYDSLVAAAREQTGQTVRDMQETTRQIIERTRKNKVKTTALTVAVSMAIVLATGIYAGNRIGWYSEQYQEMYQKFQQVSNDDFDVDLGIFCIENFYRKKSDVFDANELSFSIGLTQPDTNYGSIEYGQAELIIQLKNGEVLSYNVRENTEDFRYVTVWTTYYAKNIGSFLLECDLSEIAYIKISNLVFYEDTNAQIHNEGHEIELTVYQS